MPPKKSLGSNPLSARKGDAALREMLKGPDKPAPPPKPGAVPAAVVLTGCGAEAAFEVGVLQGLASVKGLEVEVVTGVSVGAMNAAVIVGHKGDLVSATAKLRGHWLDEIASDRWTGRNGLYRSRGDFRALLEPARLPGAIADLVGDSSHWVLDAFRHGAQIVRSGDDLATRLLWFADLSSMLSLDPFVTTVSRIVDLDAVRGSRRKLRIATANWVTGNLDTRDGNGLDRSTVHRRIVAAAARPGIFPCVEIEGIPHVEASAFVNSELAAAMDAGAEILHVPVFQAARSAKDRPASTIDALSRQLNQLRLTRFERELAELRARRPPALRVHVYRGNLGSDGSHGFLDLRRDRIASLIEHGREAALRHDCKAAGCVGGEA
jgi:predicted acylesterase/phospholipase RssA